MIAGAGRMIVSASARLGGARHPGPCVARPTQRPNTAWKRAAQQLPLRGDESGRVAPTSSSRHGRSAGGAVSVTAAALLLANGMQAGNAPGSDTPVIVFMIAGLALAGVAVLVLLRRRRR